MHLSLGMKIKAGKVDGERIQFSDNDDAEMKMGGG